MQCALYAKGKVERPIRYVRDSFFYGRTFLNDQELDAQAEHWLGHVANVRPRNDEGAADRPVPAR